MILYFYRVNKSMNRAMFGKVQVAGKAQAPGQVVHHFIQLSNKLGLISNSFISLI